MANTYTQLYIQIIFAVKGRPNLIREDFRDLLEKYICGCVKKQDQKPLAIYCMPDHTHLLVGMNGNESVARITQFAKANSSRFINENKFVKGKFAWQDGYGAFSYSRSQLDKVITYISNQPAHHRKSSFKEEYLELLRKFEVGYDERYLFEWLD